MAICQSKTNYQSLILSTLKEKVFYVLLGAFIFSAFSSFVGYKLFATGYFTTWARKQFTLIEPTISLNQNEQIYQIKEGDYLWKIAEEKYGSGFNAYDIAQKNKIVDPNNLTEGQKIIIPKIIPKKDTVGEISSLSTTQVIHKENTYTVQPGDFLWKIAEKVYGDGYMSDRIIKANKIPNINILEPGTILKIPR